VFIVDFYLDLLQCCWRWFSHYWK